MKKTVKKLISKFFGTKKAPAPQQDFPPDFDVRTIATIRSVKPYTLTSSESLEALCSSVRYIIHNHIPGSFVECGVWKGGSVMAMIYTLKELGVADRSIYLYDTFEGMTEPTSNDIDLNGIPAKELMAGYDWVRVGINEVQQNILSLGYPADKIHFIQGKVEDTLPRHAPAQLALLRLDTDWYESTLHELECLYPRMAKGGILIIDDYGHFQGARKAVDEYFEKEKIKIYLHRINYTVRAGVVQ
jgi:O-methyltransferase